MTMEAWADHLDIILKADGNELLTNAGSISAEIAKAHAESEFEKYRVRQDRLFSSDFDRFLNENNIGTETSSAKDGKGDQKRR
jgi:hypothetical protein